MTAIDISSSMITDPSMTAWSSALEVADQEVSKDLVVADKPAPAQKSTSPSILSRIGKFSADDTIKIMKFARAVIMTVGEIFVNFNCRTVAQATGFASQEGAIGAGLAGDINKARSAVEVFVDSPGSKGLGRIFDSSAKGGFFETVKNHSNTENVPFENPQTIGETLANVKHTYKRTNEFNSTIMAWHNIFKAPMWATKGVAAIAKAHQTAIATGKMVAGNSMLAASAGLFKSIASKVALFDVLSSNLPGHLSLIYYNLGVTFDVTAAAFKAGYNLSENASTSEALKQGAKAAFAALTNKEVVDNHILPAVRFAAQTALIVGCALGDGVTGGGAGMLVSIASMIKPATNMEWKGILGCVITESTIGAYRAWIKTAPKDTSAADMPLAGIAQGTRPMELAAPDKLVLSA